MWESPSELWRRLKLGREEYLQRLVTTLILDGEAPPWNTPRSPGEAGRRFLQLLDEAAFGPHDHDPPSAPEWFVDEYLLPKLEEDAANGWPDWAVLWTDRAWIIELKTEAASHRPDQLPYYLRLAAAAHPECSVDLTYVTGPLAKDGPALLEGQRYSHVTWDQVLPLIGEAWRSDTSPSVAAYVDMVEAVVNNLTRLKPSAQRENVLGHRAEEPSSEPPQGLARRAATDEAAQWAADLVDTPDSANLLELAQATAVDGRQRAVGAQTPEQLERLRDQAVAEIGRLDPDDATRRVLPWVWDAARTGGRALSGEGQEFGFELRFSKYRKVQVKP